MKNIFILTILFFSFTFSSCFKDKITHTYTIFTPVYKEKSEVYAGIKSNAPQPVKSTGKIFLYDKYIFLNEINKGVHIIDNSNPDNPVKKAFISIPGNLDIAVKGNTLYADLYTDMVIIDITDPLNAKYIKYIPYVFPERAYSNGFIADSTKIIVDWITKDTTVDATTPNRWWDCPNCLFALSNSKSESSSAVSIPGIAGSMARFAIVQNYLYTVNISSLGVFDIATSGNAVMLDKKSLGWNIETIYPFKDKLFIGSQNGMFIYNIANPAQPEQEGQFTHATACDPVIADDNYAYITLRNGTACNTTINRLDIVDVSSGSYLNLLKSYNMTNPHGLSKDEHLLFICDGQDGLKIYDASQPQSLKLIQHIKGIETYDAIAWNKNLIVSVKEGLYQYDYTNADKIRLRSKITKSN